MKRTPWPELEGENEENERIGKGEERRFRALSEVRFISFILPRFLRFLHVCTVYYITSLIKPKPEPEPEIEIEPGWGAAAFSEKRTHLLPCGRV